MIVETAPAKINLALHVRARRADGYHELETLFAFAQDGDTVTVAPADRWSFTVTGPYATALAASGFPATSGVQRGSSDTPDRDATSAFVDAQDLVQKAANSFLHVFHDTPPQAITLDKHLPIASGIGGGSADAAATLRALARTIGLSPDDHRLLAVARPLGADVPACLLGRTSLGTGAGEELVPIDGLPDQLLLLVNPGVAVSTAAVFRGWDGVDRGGIGGGPLMERARAGRNDLAAPARGLAPVIAEVEELLAAAPGVILSRMSGSGATCFALFEEPGALDAAADRARARGWWTLATRLAP